MAVELQGSTAFWTGLPVSQADAPKQPADGAPASWWRRRRCEPPPAGRRRWPSR